MQERPWALVWKSFVLPVRFPCRVSVPFGHERLPILFLRWFQSSLRRSVLGHGFEGRFPVWGHELAPVLVWRSLHFRL